MGNHVLVSGLSFGRTVIGIATRPYETYRRIVSRGTMWELAYVGVLVSLYCYISRIRVAPVVLTYLVTAGLFWCIGSFAGAKGRLTGFFIAWGYTLVPTLVWFSTTSLLYVLIPPPRSTRPEGFLFSILYLLFSATLLFWKVILSYLALRFGLRLDLGKISLVSLIVLPILFLYSIALYRMGIFRIPFL